MQTMNAIQIAHCLLKEKLCTASCVVDATAGNGNDTRYLAENSPAYAKIYAFDIQESALEATRRTLLNANLSGKVKLILDNHANIDAHVLDKVEIVVFNLGYLPGGDHAVTTVAETTRVAVEKAVNLLALNGLAAIVSYPGHDSGALEDQCLGAYVKTLPPKNFTVGCYRMINHAKTSPALYIIEKVRS